MSHCEHDRGKLLVFGFIHDIKSSIWNHNKNEPIPLCIIEVCVGYYRNIHKIFAHNESQFYMVNIHQNGIANILMPNEKSRKLMNENKYQLSSSWCYIPKIRTNYDAFIGGVSKGENYPNNSPENPCIVLFKANENDTFMIEYDLLVSNQTISTKNKRLKNYPIYCDKHGSVFEDDGHLYQFQPSKKNDFNFNFLQIHSKSDHDKENDDYNDDNMWLSLCYQKKTETIFTISNSVESLSPITDLNIPFLQMNADGVLTTQKKKSIKCKTAFCSIFDLNCKIWKDIDNYQYETDFDDTFRRFGICENQYDFDIYIQSNCGHTANYDLKKNSWFTIFEDVYNEEMHFGGTPLLWFGASPFVLFLCCDPYFGFFDTRDKKWCKINNINHSISSLFL